MAHTTKNSIGRSMVELLGVLAIIGVLTICALFGYRYLNYLVKENKTLDSISKATAGAITAISDERTTEAHAEEFWQISANQIISEVPIDENGFINTPLNTDISAFVVLATPTHGQYMEVQLDNVTYNVCQKLLGSNIGYKSAYLANNSKYGVYSGATDEEIETFCAQRVDAFKRSPWSPGEAVNDEANMILCYAHNASDCQLDTDPTSDDDNDDVSEGDIPCTHKGHTYQSGTRISNCAICSNGSIVLQPDKTVDVCHKCNDDDPSAAAVLRSEDKTVPCDGVCCKQGCNDKGTACMENDTCDGSNNGCQKCENGEWVADNDLDGKTCQDSCHVCSNGACVAKENCCVSDENCLSCQTCSDNTCVLKSGYELDDEGECCPTTNLYTEEGKKQCCLITEADCEKVGKLNKETCKCECGSADGCCPSGSVLCNGVCCAVGAVCNTSTKQCCGVGEVLILDSKKKNHCCPEGNVWTSGGCCPSDKRYWASVDEMCCERVDDGHCCTNAEPYWAEIDGVCCENLDAVFSGHCCPKGQGWNKAEGNDKCCEHESSGHCCTAEEDTWASADNKCCKYENIGKYKRTFGTSTYTSTFSPYHCCSETEPYWSSVDNKCCANVVLDSNDNNHCCPEGNVWTSGGCCPSDKRHWASVDGLCCAYEDEGHCCTKDKPYWAEHDNVCCANWQSAVYGYCCPTGQKWASSDKKCCEYSVCDGVCCPSGDYACQKDQVTGKSTCCSAAELE